MLSRVHLPSKSKISRPSEITIKNIIRNTDSAYINVIDRYHISPPKDFRYVSKWAFLTLRFLDTWVAAMMVRPERELESGSCLLSECTLGIGVGIESKKKPTFKNRYTTEWDYEKQVLIWLLQKRYKFVLKKNLVLLCYTKLAAHLLFVNVWLLRPKPKCKRCSDHQTAWRGESL